MPYNLLIINSQHQFVQASEREVSIPNASSLDAESSHTSHNPRGDESKWQNQTRQSLLLNPSNTQLHLIATTTQLRRLTDPDLTDKIAVNEADSNSVDCYVENFNS